MDDCKSFFGNKGFFLFFFTFKFGVFSVHVHLNSFPTAQVSFFWRGGGKDSR